MSHLLSCRITLSIFTACALLVCAAHARATDISGTISTTLLINGGSRVVGDVTWTVTGEPCIRIIASGVTLELNGFTMTGQGDPKTACGGGVPATFDPQNLEDGIDLQGQTDVTVRGPGLIQQFRLAGIFINNST
ncbi:MAG: hypothetical protein HRJ53_23810 [Acidobacteria bacterium Pan2503]|uniref:Uncharacterized protein n=1 Tax=Candidatus Acidiferrum panamense TaxID=2741543 RepID=A0A7V8NUZ5_9BACT|nr:hypothetical protein [Candidatus Acidoferrum panamensis]